MVKWLPKADTRADAVLRWSGIYALMTSGYAWLAGLLPWFGPLSLPEKIAIAIPAALVTLLAVTASLALFRYFRPLSHPSPVDGPTPTASYDDSALLAGLAALGNDLDALKGAIQTQNEDFQAQIVAVGQQFGRMQTAIMTEIKRIEALESLNEQYTRRQVASLYQALAAIYHREHLAALAVEIEDGAVELSAPTTLEARYDADQWEEWEGKHSAWRRVVQQWADLAGCYADGMDGKVFDIHPDQFKQKGQAKVEQFPDTEAFIAYKGFWIVLKQWRGWREEGERAVHQAAFNGATSSDRPIILGGAATDELPN